MRIGAGRYALGLMLIAVVFGGCRDAEQESAVGLRQRDNEMVEAIPILLSEPAAATPITFDGARMDHALGHSDRKELELLVGRYVRRVEQVKSVETSFADVVVAARITLEHEILFCTKRPSGAWELVQVSYYTDD